CTLFGCVRASLRPGVASGSATAPSVHHLRSSRRAARSVMPPPTPAAVEYALHVPDRGHRNAHRSGHIATDDLRWSTPDCAPATPSVDWAWPTRYHARPADAPRQCDGHLDAG